MIASWSLVRFIFDEFQLFAGGLLLQDSQRFAGALMLNDCQLVAGALMLKDSGNGCQLVAGSVENPRKKRPLQTIVCMNKIKIQLVAVRSLA